MKKQVLRIFSMLSLAVTLTAAASSWATMALTLTVEAPANLTEMAHSKSFSSRSLGTQAIDLHPADCVPHFSTLNQNR
jgi:hypothetical protein